MGNQKVHKCCSFVVNTNLQPVQWWINIHAELNILSDVFNIGIHTFEHVELQSSWVIFFFPFFCS